MANVAKAKKYNNHRIEEVLRAQSAVGRENYVAAVNSPAHIGHKELKNTFTLSIPSIKKDLAKDFIYAVLAVSLLIFLTHSSFGYSQIVALFAR